MVLPWSMSPLDNGAPPMSGPNGIRRTSWTSAGTTSGSTAKKHYPASLSSALDSIAHATGLNLRRKSTPPHSSASAALSPSVPANLGDVEQSALASTDINVEGEVTCFPKPSPTPHTATSGLLDVSLDTSASLSRAKTLPTRTRMTMRRSSSLEADQMLVLTSLTREKLARMRRWIVSLAVVNFDLDVG